MWVPSNYRSLLSSSGGATCHEGEHWLAVGDSGSGSTELYTVDLETGYASETGLSVPSDTIDALTTGAFVPRVD